MNSFVIVNQTNDPLLTTEILQTGLDALIQHIANFRKAWNLGDVEIGLGYDTLTYSDQIHVTSIIPSILDAPEDAAYHTIDEEGRPILVISLEAAKRESPTGGVERIWELISHEIPEELINPFVNRWVDMPDGKHQTPLEVVDWVQGDLLLNGMSNFTLPAFFCPETKDKQLDWMGLCKAPLVVRPGGYYEQRIGGPDGESKLVFGERVDPRVRQKKEAARITGRDRSRKVRVTR